MIRGLYLWVLFVEFAEQPGYLMPIKMSNLSNFFVRYTWLVSLGALLKNAQDSSLSCFPMNSAFSFRISCGAQATMQFTSGGTPRMA